MNLESLGKIVLLFGLVLLLVGGLLYVLGRSFGVQHLPGDIEYKRDGFSFFFPLGTSIVVSIVLTVILNIVFIILKNR